MTRLDSLRALYEAVKAGALGHYDWIDHDKALTHDMLFIARDAYNGSVDAALAFIAAMLPGCTWYLGHLDEPSLGYVCTISDGHYIDSPSWRDYADNPATALLLAGLAALIAEEEAK